MSAHIIQLRASRDNSGVSAALHRPRAAAGDALSDEFAFWTGASGERYVHSVYALTWCPELPDGNYLLVHRGEDGTRRVLNVGRMSRHSPSLNLAELRQKGADLGANEVHVHLLARDAKQAKLIAFDLRAIHFGLPPISSARH